MAALAACSRAPDIPASLEPLTTAPARAGAGLGDLELGRTTLVDFVRRHHPRAVSVLFGDDVGYEIRFARGQLRLTFPVEPLGHDTDARAYRDSLRDLETFLLSHPDVGAAALQRIDVAAGDPLTHTRFAADLVGDVGVGDAWDGTLPDLGPPTTTKETGRRKIDDETDWVERAFRWPGLDVIANGREDEPLVIRRISLSTPPE